MSHIRRSALTFIFALCSSSAALTGANGGDKPLRQNSTLSRLTALRDSFVRQARIAGLHCPIAPPKIVLTDIASFGSYEPETNTLQTPEWEQLSADERLLFFRLAGPGASSNTAKALFERGTHQWVFVHEMGHWWQACTHANQDRQHYQVEYDANRIAAAYWRETDPNLMADLTSRFQKIIDGDPSPVPSGQTAEKFFNDNYEKLAGTPVYTWFQAQMITTVSTEKPAPTFALTLKEDECNDHGGKSVSTLGSARMPC